MRTGWMLLGLLALVTASVAYAGYGAGRTPGVDSR